MWVDLGRCAHLLSAPLDLAYLRAAMHKDDRVLTFVGTKHRSGCYGSLALSSLTTRAVRVHGQVMGGSSDAIAKLHAEYLATHRWLLDHGHVVTQEWQALSLAHGRDPSLFFAVPATSNVQGIDMVERTCWATRVLSATAPHFELMWPPPDAQIAPEEAVGILGLHRLESDEGLVSMWQEHRYALTPDVPTSEVTAQVQVCARVSALSSESFAPGACVEDQAGAGVGAEGDAGGVDDKKSDGTVWMHVSHHLVKEVGRRAGFPGARSPGGPEANPRDAQEGALCTVSFRCGDGHALWLGELPNGRFKVEVQLQTLHGLPVTPSQTSFFEIQRDKDWRVSPAGLRAAPHLESLLDLPLIVSAQGVCEDGSFRARCRVHQNWGQKDLGAETTQGQLRAAMGLSPADAFDAEMASVVITHWQTPSNAELFLFDISTLFQTPGGQWSVRSGGSSAAWQRMLGDIGCNPHAGCHSLDLHGRAPLGHASHGAQGEGQGGADHGYNDRLGNGTIDPSSVSDWFQKNELAFVYLSSSYEAERGGGGANGQKPTYTDAFRPWLEKVRLGGYLAGSGYFLSSGCPTPHKSRVARRLLVCILGVSPCHVHRASPSLLPVSSSCLCLLHPPLRSQRVCLSDASSACIRRRV